MNELKQLFSNFHKWRYMDTEDLYHEYLETENEDIVDWVKDYGDIDQWNRLKRADLEEQRGIEALEQQRQDV